jgi:CheY-like chemotaxis protein
MDPLDRQTPQSDVAGASDAIPDDAPHTHAADAADGGQRTILVVENDEQGRRLIEQILAFSGYVSISAANGQEALEVLDRAPVDLVLMDLSMPVLDGYQTVERMRRRPEYAEAPIVAVSGHTTGEERDLALRSGFSEYLSKPFRPAELVRLIDRLLSDAAPRESGPE